MNKLFAILVLLFALNCKSTEHQTKMAKEDIVLIGKGNLFGSGAEGIEKQNLIVTGSDQWNGLLKKMNSVNNVSDSFSETKVDFSKYTLIAIFDDVKGTGGHSIELDINTNSENIEVNIDHKGPEGIATTVMTQPFYIVKIPKSDLPILFK
ncbi:hypothetical protein [uncultured Winogradskyella sp.]|uniref:hypothetical protein n=1 Tax=uncultured Winogradskyella sp. TaxID=395353 RepID=UPI002619922E|nr:hypothetical protein [uncultured Winogradskyella sp.]